MVWDLSLSLSLSLSLYTTPPPMGQGEEENMRGMGVFDLGGLNLEGGERIYIKGQTKFLFGLHFHLLFCLIWQTLLQIT